MRAAIERNDAHVVDLLHLNRHVLGRLHDAIDAHVGGKQIGKAVVNAAILQAETLGRVGDSSESPRRGGADPGTCRSGRRQPPVSRIHDQRRLVLEVAIRQPVLAVASGRAKAAWLGVGQDGKVQGVAERGLGVGREQRPGAAFEIGQLLRPTIAACRRAGAAARAAWRCCSPTRLRGSAFRPPSAALSMTTTPFARRAMAAAPWRPA